MFLFQNQTILLVQIFFQRNQLLLHVWSYVLHSYQFVAIRVVCVLPCVAQIDCPQMNTYIQMGSRGLAKPRASKKFDKRRKGTSNFDMLCLEAILSTFEVKVGVFFLCFFVLFVFAIPWAVLMP